MRGRKFQQMDQRFTGDTSTSSMARRWPQHSALTGCIGLIGPSCHMKWAEQMNFERHLLQLKWLKCYKLSSWTSLRVKKKKLSGRLLAGRHEGGVNQPSIYKRINDSTHVWEYAKLLYASVSNIGPMYQRFYLLLAGISEKIRYGKWSLESTQLNLSQV